MNKLLLLMLFPLACFALEQQVELVTRITQKQWPIQEIRTCRMNAEQCEQEVNAIARYEHFALGEIRCEHNHASLKTPTLQAALKDRSARLKNRLMAFPNAEPRIAGIFAAIMPTFPSDETTFTAWIDLTGQPIRNY